MTWRVIQNDDRVIKNDDRVIKNDDRVMMAIVAAQGRIQRQWVEPTCAVTQSKRRFFAFANMIARSCWAW